MTTEPADLVVWTCLGFVVGAAVASHSRRLMTSHPPRPLLLRASTVGVTATLFALVVSRTTSMIELLAHSVFAVVGVQLATIDIVDLRLPRALIWPTMTALLVLLVTSAARTGDYSSLARAATGAVGMVVFYLVIAMTSRGGVGAGDVRLAAPVGLMLAWHDWPTLIIGLLLGFLGSGVIAICRVATRQSISRPSVPHGPAMLISAMAAVLF
jgi:leader peptidase (prepilin peptidase)/N-methyltransferase